MNILITGATGGIGYELSKKLAINHHVTAVARNFKKLKKIKKSIKQDIKIVSTDISKKDRVYKLFSSITNLDAIINTAAIIKPIGKFTDNNLDEWKENIEVNLLGTVYSCHFGIPLLLKSKKGKIINFAGGGSAYPRLNHTAYATGKTAVVRFTEIIAGEFPDLDINVIAPGAYKTNMWAEETHEKEPAKWGDINRLIAFIEFLLSNQSNGISGKFIHYKDNWENFDIKKIKNDFFTLRRIEK